MGGLFEGFGRSTKKKNGNNSTHQNPAPDTATAPKDGGTSDTIVTPSGSDAPAITATQNKAEIAEKALHSTLNTQPQNPRSNTMRLSKGSASKQDNDFDISSDTAIPSFSSNAPKPSTSSETQNPNPSATIGPKIRFKGEISGEEDLLIEGKVEGTIELKDNHLTIGKQGTVKADVIAKSITVEGTVEGDIIASERIAIKSSSNVSGNVSADRVTLDDGAKFRGSIDMDTKPSEFKRSSSSKSSTSSESNTTQTAKA